MTLLLLPVLAWGEELPDSAELPDAGESADMEERFSAPSMDSEELNSLFLESPVELGNAEDDSGMNSLSDEDRYRESDLFFRERRQSEQLRAPLRPEGREDRPESPPLLAPLREL
jgi:hypothetical protein